MQNNPLVLFLVEIINRIGTKTPKVFVILQWFSSICLAVTGLPSLLTYLNINLIPHALNFENHAVALASGVMLFMAFLPTQPNAVAMSSNGAILYETDSSKLPFTAASQQKIALKENLPTVADITNTKN